MIEITNTQKKYRINRNKFRSLLNRLVEYFKLKDPEISLVFTDTKTIKALNRRFLDRPGPTDVLSFPLKEKGPDGKYYLGEIIISVPQAFKQSSARKHGLERELELLVIHGFLHLLGYEHREGVVEEEEEKMREMFIKCKK